MKKTISLTREEAELYALLVVFWNKVAAVNVSDPRLTPEQLNVSAETLHSWAV